MSEEETIRAETEIVTHDYTVRRDTLAIKKELEEKVPDSEYWNTFKSFLNGRCARSKFNEVMEKHLDTPEKRRLHNDLIRAIFYNSNFTITPPPGVEIPKRHPSYKISDNVTKLEPTKTQYFQTYRSADLRSIPSLEQLQRRFDMTATGVNIPLEAAKACKWELVRYIMFILRKSLDSVEKPESGQRHLRITTDNIKIALTEDPQFSQMISGELLSRFYEYF